MIACHPSPLGIDIPAINTADLGKLKAEQSEKLHQVWQEIKAKVPANKQPAIKKLVTKVQAGAAVKEKTKSIEALFLKASAVIMEPGGFLSHGAIVAREYGIPAVVNIPGVMRAIPEGRQVEVDGDEGRVIYLN